MDWKLRSQRRYVFLPEHIHLHLNPVRRGLVAQVVDWKWPSAGWFEGRQPNNLRPDPIDFNLLQAGSWWQA